MTKSKTTLLKKLFSIYFAFSLTFSHLSPFFLFASQVQASQADSTQESLQQLDSVVFNPETHSLEIDFSQDNLSTSYSLTYDYADTINNAIDSEVLGSTSVTIGTESSGASNKALPSRAILKLQAADSDYVSAAQLDLSFLEDTDDIQSKQEVSFISYETSDISLTTSETMWLTQGVHREKNLKTESRYEFPLNKSVSVTFTELPEKMPEHGGILEMAEIQLTEEQVAELGAQSATAYEITSKDMENGTFKYDLTLPNPIQDGEASIQYSEDGETFEQATGDEFVTEQKDGNNVVRITGLDHFTVFVVTGAPVPVGVDCESAGASVDGECFSDLQSAVNAADDGDTIEILTDLTTTTQISINENITINGNGHTITATHTSPESGVNDNVIVINAGNPTLSDLVIEGVSGTQLQGIQVWNAAATLNDITVRNNDKAGIHVNGSTVTVNDVTTHANGLSFGGVVISNGTLTLGGQSMHTSEPISQVRRNGGTILDTNAQYSYWTIPFTSIRIYTLKSAPVSPLNLSATVTDNSVEATWNTVSYANSYDYEITGVESRSGNTSDLEVTETNLPNGDYEIKVRSVAQSGLSGAWSSLVPFTIDFISHPDPESKFQLSLGGHLYRDYELNDCFNLTSCNNKAEKLGADWKLNLYTELESGSWELLNSTTSIANGNFSFPAVKEAGIYHVCEEVNPGWTQQVQNWSGTPYHIATPNESGNAAEGPYCRTISYDDTASKSNAFYFGNVDTTKPTTEVVNPAAGGFYNGGTITLNLKSTDYQSGIAKVVANIHQVGKTPTHLKPCVNTNVNPAVAEHEFECQIDVSVLAEGEYFVKANAVDLAGNTSNTISWEFVVDKTAPSFEVITPENNSTLNGDIHRVIVKVSDLSGVTKILFNLSGNTASYELGKLNNSLKPVDGSPDEYYIDFNMSLLSDGPHHISLRGTDGAGNTRYWNNNANFRQHVFNVDTTAPEAPELLTPEDGAFVNGASITQEWSESDDDVVSYVYESFNDSEETSPRWAETFTTTSKTANNVAETTYWWKVKAVDHVGNESDWSELWQITVDNTNPQISYVSPVSGEYYSDDVNIEVEVTEENPHQYQFRIRGMVDGTATGQFFSTGWVTVDETFDGTFNHIWDSNEAPYGDGQYRLDFDFKDKAGNQVKKNLIFYVDNGNPTIPQDLTVIPVSPTNQTSQTWSWTASTDIGGSGVFQYFYQVLGASSEIITSGHTTATNVTTSLLNGLYSFFVQAEDTVGNTSDNAELTDYLVDTVHPITQITSPVADQVISGKYTFTGVSTDADPSSGMKNVIMRIGSQADNTNMFTTVLGINTETGEWSYEVDTEAESIPDGYYNVRARTQDNAGNNGIPGMHVLRDFIIDNSGPEISNINMLVNGVPSTLVKPGDTVRISAEITDEYLDVDRARIIARQRPNTPETILFTNQTMLVDPEVADTYFYEFTVPATYTSDADLNQVLNGNFFRIRAYDEQNNESMTGTENRFTIDNTLPESTITGPGAVDPNDQTTIYVDNWDGSVFGEATDTTPGQVAGVEIEIARTIETVTTYWNGIEWSTDTNSRVQAQSSDDFATWTYQIPSPFSDELTSGTYTVTSRAYDMAGNKENSAKLIIVLDREIPEVNISVNPSEPDGDNNWYETRPTVTLTEGESFSGIKEIQYSWNNETGPWTTYTSPFQIPGQGSYVLYYQAINNADVASATGIKNLRWDETDLTDGPIDVSANPSRTSGSTSTISWEAAEDNIGIDRYEIVWKLKDGDLRFSKSVSSSTRETEIDQMTEEGEWEVFVRAFDPVGNMKEGTTLVRVIRTAPAAPTLTLAGTAIGSANLTWNAVENASRYIIYYGVNPGEYIFAASVGNTTDYTVQGLAADTYYFMVRAVDDVDNQSSNSNEVSTGALAGAPGTIPGAGGTTPAEGFDDAGDVLGDDDDAESVELDEDGNPINRNGEVAGAIDENCNTMQQYLPWILLAVLSVGAVALELLLKRHTGLAKMGVAIGLLVVILGTHYVFNNPDCFVTGSITNIVNSWFIAFAVVLAGLARLAGFAFIEEVEV